MSHLNTKKRSSVTRILPVVVAVVALLLAVSAHAAVPGIKGSSFALSASDGYSSQPDGALIYSWGYSCAGSATVPNFQPFAPDPAFPNGGCPPMQLPGPTLIVTEGIPVTVTLTNHLPAAAGRTSIIFAGFQVTTPGCTTQSMEQWLFCPQLPQPVVNRSGQTLNYKEDLIIGWQLPLTTIRRPATTANTCSSGARWTPRFTGKRKSK